MSREAFELHTAMVLDGRVELSGEYVSEPPSEVAALCPAIGGKNFITWYVDKTGCWCVYSTDGPPPMFCYIPCT